MKIVFLNARLDVKQYHLACALADRYRAQCYFLHYPFTRFLPLYQRLKFIGKKVLYSWGLVKMGSSASAARR